MDSQRSLFYLAASLSLVGSGAGIAQDLASDSRRALAGDEAAIVRLREAGPVGLSAFLDAADLGEVRSGMDEGLLAALDRVCAQRDCAASRLYWFTDLEAAKREAARRGVPILSLRLLGRLDEEQSCANSRYFRLAVYANERVSQWLRRNVVLHWSSERPAPRVRVDFGDGRALEGTLTGNSAHYLLDCHGRPVDVLPGLYSPQAFLSWLEASAPLARDAAAAGDRELGERLRTFHRGALDELGAALERDLRELGEADPEAVAQAALAQPLPRRERPTAVEATAATAAKSAAEMPLLTAAFDRRPERDELLDIPILALMRRWRAECDRGCRALAARRAPWVAAELDEAIRRFEAALAVDTVRNEIRLHARLHGWFMQADQPFAWPELNRLVYDELFLSPRSDPWLGLEPREVFSVLAPVPGAG